MASPRSSVASPEIGFQFKDLFVRLHATLRRFLLISCFMKRSFPFLFCLLIFIQWTSAQSQFETITDSDSSKIFKGIISRELLEKESSYTWYKTNQQNYHPNAAATEALRKTASTIQLLVFMGTWCEDSHFIIPKLFTLLDASGFPTDRVSLIGVDRSKKTLSHLTEAFAITNVPTIIVLKNGKELGRVVEYGKSGTFDKDLAEIVNLAL